MPEPPSYNKGTYWLEWSHDVHCTVHTVHCTLLYNRHYYISIDLSSIILIYWGFSLLKNYNIISLIH